MVLKQANVLKAEGESSAIKIIDEQLKSSPSYLEWLKTQDGMVNCHWFCGGGAGGQGLTPFIEIPTSRNEQNSTS